MRLIDADHLRKWIINNWSTYQGTWNSVTIDAILDQIEAEDIYIEPDDTYEIVDLVPIIHGHWIEVEIPHTLPYELKVYKCSECIHLVYDNRFTLAGRYRYCPNCGALMDKEVERI